MWGKVFEFNLESAESFLGQHSTIVSPKVCHDNSQQQTK